MEARKYRSPVIERILAKVTDEDRSWTMEWAYNRILSGRIDDGKAWGGCLRCICKLLNTI